MPKFPTFPILYDECKQISISSLNHWGYLKPEQWKNGIITWSRGEGEYKETTAEIRICVNTFSENPYLELDYTCNGTPIKYQVPFEAVPSNLGKGNVWYFNCPKTGKRCRKLYLIDTYFYHRSAYKGMYEKQTASHNNHYLFKLFDKAKRAEKAEEQICGKHFKKYYNGKPTKRYSRLLKIAEQTISQEELERLYIA